MDDLENPNPGTNGAATSETTPAASAGTVPVGGEANRQSASTEESFTKLDVNTLPPQLKQTYDNMLRDYKQKTTELAEQRKKYGDYDDVKKKADWYDNVSNQQEFVNMWNEFVEKSNAKPNADPNDPVAQLQSRLEKVENERVVERQRMEAIQSIEAFANAVNEAGEKVNGDFDKLNELVIGSVQGEDGTLSDFSLLRAAMELAPGKTLQERITNGYQAAQKLYQSILEEGRKAGMGKMLSKFKNSTEVPGHLSTDKGVFTGDAKALSAREARELAEKKVVVR